jgi:hypothetical protein
MFFRRERPRKPTFDEYLQNLERSGFAVEKRSGGAQAQRDGFAVMIADRPDGPRLEGRAGRLMGDEFGLLVDGGFQKFFRAPSGKSKPALADELKDLYNFQEDLKEALGLVSLYNEGLGTTSTYYLYDRVKDRDCGVPKRVWEK